MIRSAVWVAGIAGVLILSAGCGDEARREGARGGSEASRAPAAHLATAEFEVEGMTCGGCAIATEISVRKLDGVTSVEAGYDEASGTGRCTVVHDPTVVSTDEIAAAIRDAGFEPTPRSNAR